ncbi:conjugal transfer protein [Bacteroidia bacterium]|nr:conjugal transfer protein [Bacteroidia bacterium]
MAKKINLDEIDESFIVSAVKKDKSSVPENPERLLTPSPAKTEQPPETKPETEESVQPPVQSETPREDGRRKRKPQDYESLFIRESTVTARLGKTVYIRKEFHDRILKIVQVVGGNEVSLFSYIDNVLAHHFENFQEDISQAYKQRISNDVF